MRRRRELGVRHTSRLIARVSSIQRPRHVVTRPSRSKGHTERISAQRTRYPAAALGRLLKLRRATAPEMATTLAMAATEVIVSNLRQRRSPQDWSSSEK